jgi:hypothetical protein
MEVFRGVLVLRVIAAADMAAGKAKPQVHPVVTHGQALLATVRRPRLDVVDLVKMRVLHAVNQVQMPS